MQVTVLRNPNLPEWGLPNYSADVREDAPVFSDVIKVQATDKDPDVRKASLINNKGTAYIGELISHGVLHLVFNFVFCGVSLTFI